MKTEDAFALKNFEEERILARKYFRAVVGDLRGTDDDILSSFAATNARTSSDLAANVDALRRIKGLGARYIQRLLNHELKLERIERRRKTTDSCRLWQLQQFYLARIQSCGELQRRISRLIVEGQKLLPKFFNRELGERLRRAREAIGLSRREVAAELGMSFQILGHYERGERELSPYTLTKLAAILGRSPHYFLGLIE